MNPKSSPLVSVICLSYNQVDYIKYAVKSVLNQTYDNIELIIVDDASTDNSVAIIKELVLQSTINIQTIYNQENLGNCKSFNIGFASSRGEYVIDLAADDILHPNRIAVGVDTFSAVPEKYGVNYSPIVQINEGGAELRTSLDYTPQGNLYQQLIEKFIISAPSMMIKREVLDVLKGYDEELTYEDFDFWIRSSRHFHYCASSEALTSKRELESGLSKKQYRLLSTHLTSTFKVCKKIYHLNQNKSEDQSLLRRIRYELKHTLINLRIDLSFRYCILYLKTLLRTF